MFYMRTLKNFRERIQEIQEFIRPYVGTDELINGNQRRCLWIEDHQVEIANSVARDR